MKVFVYFNLHRRCWSVKALEGVNKGKVIAHDNVVILRDVTPRVSEAGRQRVLREKHAFMPMAKPLAASMPGASTSPHNNSQERLRCLSL